MTDAVALIDTVALIEAVARECKGETAELSRCWLCTESDLGTCKTCYEKLHGGKLMSAIDTHPVEWDDSNPPTVPHDRPAPVRYATTSELTEVIEAQWAMANAINSLVRRIDELERTHHPRALERTVTPAGYVMRPCGCYVIVGQGEHVCPNGMRFTTTPDRDAELSGAELAAQGSAYSGGGGV